MKYTSNILIKNIASETSNQVPNVDRDLCILDLECKMLSYGRHTMLLFKW